MYGKILYFLHISKMFSELKKNFERVSVSFININFVKKIDMGFVSQFSTIVLITQQLLIK